MAFTENTLIIPTVLLLQLLFFTPALCLAADVVFAMDVSGSIREQGKDNQDKLKDFIINSARAMALRYSLVRFGLVTFGDNATIIASLRDYQ